MLWSIWMDRRRWISIWIWICTWMYTLMILLEYKHQNGKRSGEVFWVAKAWELSNVIREDRGFLALRYWPTTPKGLCNNLDAMLTHYVSCLIWTWKFYQIYKNIELKWSKFYVCFLDVGYKVEVRCGNYLRTSNRGEGFYTCRAIKWWLGRIGEHDGRLNIYRFLKYIIDGGMVFSSKV